MTLSQARRAFTRHLALFLVWADKAGFELALDEGRVINPRPVTKGGLSFVAEDRKHMRGSVHYLGLAVDLNLYRGSDYIEDGGDPAWTALGQKWELMGKEAGLPLRAGRFFGSVDANHFSMAWEGKA